MELETEYILVLAGNNVDDFFVLQIGDHTRDHYLLFDKENILEYVENIAKAIMFNKKTNLPFTFESIRIDEDIEVPTPKKVENIKTETFTGHVLNFCFDIDDKILEFRLEEQNGNYYMDHRSENFMNVLLKVAESIIRKTKITITFDSIRYEIIDVKLSPDNTSMT